MTINELTNKILALSADAAMARHNKSNFIVIPTDEGIVKVDLTVALTKDTKNHKAFDVTAAKDAYNAYTAASTLKQTERANKKAEKNAISAQQKAATAEKNAAYDTIVADYIKTMPANSTCSDILMGLGDKVPNDLLALGRSLKRLTTAGVLTCVMSEDNKRKYYTKA